MRRIEFSTFHLLEFAYAANPVDADLSRILRGHAAQVRYRELHKAPPRRPDIARLLKDGDIPEEQQDLIREFIENVENTNTSAREYAEQAKQAFTDAARKAETSLTPVKGTVFLPDSYKSLLRSANYPNEGEHPAESGLTENMAIVVSRLFADGREGDLTLNSGLDIPDDAPRIVKMSSFVRGEKQAITFDQYNEPAFARSLVYPKETGFAFIWAALNLENTNHANIDPARNTFYQNTPVMGFSTQALH